MTCDAESIFTAARRCPTEKRAAYLDAACGDDASLRARVDALLAAEANTRKRRTRVADPDATAC